MIIITRYTPMTTERVANLKHLQCKIVSQLLHNDTNESRYAISQTSEENCDFCAVKTDQDQYDGKRHMTSEAQPKSCRNRCRMTHSGESGGGHAFPLIRPPPPA